MLVTAESHNDILGKKTLGGKKKSQHQLHSWKPQYNPGEGADSQRAFWRAGENIVCVFITSYQPYSVSTLHMPAACKLLKILLHPHFPEL